jgi:hypothetical protein
MWKITRDGLVDRIICGCLDMKCLYCMLQFISFNNFVVCAYFAKGMNGGCDDFYLLFFNGFQKWWALQRLRKAGCQRR